MLGTFVDLASALGQKVGAMFVKQGVQTPAQRPVSTQGDSFDLWAGAKKLLEPVTSIFDPRTKAGVSLLEGATDVGNAVFNSLGRNVGSYLDNLFGGGNQSPSQAATATTNDVRATGAFGSQYLDLGKAFQLFSQIQGGNPSATAPAPQSNNNMILIVGFVALGAVMLLTARRAN